MKTEVKQRNAERMAGGFTKVKVSRLADVSERFVYFWYRGERSSQKVQAAHNTLYAASLSGRRSA
jgi:hypothetical protein